MKQDTKVIIAGRTDKGVHALGNVFNFHTSHSIPPEKISYALNSILPNDIYIKKSELTGKEFHSRYSAKSRIYVYKFSYTFTPFLRNYRNFIKKNNINIDKIKEAAKLFLGEHNFNGFRAKNCGAKNPIRTITKFNIKDYTDGFDVTIEANAFLKNMIRVIIGTLIEHCNNKISLQDIKNSLTTGDRHRYSVTAEPQGLFLKEVKYPDNDKTKTRDL